MNKIKGVWIEAAIWNLKGFSIMEKLFLQKIKELDNENGCVASNAFFSEFYSVSKSRCTQIIKSLENKGAIKITIIKKGKNITKRVLNFLNTLFSKLNTPIENIKHPYLENSEYNSKEINNKLINTIKEKDKEIEDLKKQIEKLKNSSIDSSESTTQPKPLEFINEYLFICEQFTSITGKGIRNKKTDALIVRSDKYKLIKARLKEGATVEEMIKIIELKEKQWKGTEYEKYVRFSTLFNKTKFEIYLDELEATAPISNESHPEAPTDTKERFKYFRNLFLKYAPHLEKRLVNTEYKDRIYQKKDAEGLIRDLERQNPQLLEL